MVLTLKPREQIKCQSEEHRGEEGSVHEDSEKFNWVPSYIIHGLLEDAAYNSRPREELIQCEVQIVSHRALKLELSPDQAKDGQRG